MNVLLEHSASPGSSYEDRLLFDGGYAILNEMDLHESTSDDGVKHIKFRGLLQQAETVNKNKRMYSRGVLDENVKRLQETIDAGGLVGELDHPSDSIIHFSDASHRIVKMWWDGNKLMGEGLILNTPCGKVLKALISDGVRIGMSSRGVGNGKVNEEGVLVIGESYKLITFDCVADPSTYAAFQEKVSEESKQTQSFTELETNNSDSKNEASSIDRISGGLLLACLSSMVQQKTEDIKMRLS